MKIPVATDGSPFGEEAVSTDSNRIFHLIYSIVTAKLCFQSRQAHG